MSLLQQAIQLLSEAPGNIVYHLVTLFALQVVFALSISQWQRDRTDLAAWRNAWAAGAIFLARVGLLLAGVLLVGGSVTAVSVLAPLEQAVHTITVLFLIWAFIPHSTRFPRLGHVLLGLSVAIIGVMTLSFIQLWQAQAALGEAYNGSQQATVWGIIQLIILGLGLVYLLSQSRLRVSLPVFIIGLLLLAHVAHFWNYPEIIPTTTNIPYWIRLGDFIVFPLWAVLAYRQMLTPLLAVREAQQPLTAQMAEMLQLATGVVHTMEMETAVSQAVTMAAQMSGATFAGIALTHEQNPQQLQLTSNLAQAVQLHGDEKLPNWYLNRTDWPSFRQAWERLETIVLWPDGMGARQLRDWYQEMGIAPLGPLLIQPLVVKQDVNGLLLLAGPAERQDWNETERELVKAIAKYVAQVVDNGRYLAKAIQSAATAAPAAVDTAVSGRIVALETERDQLRAELDTTVSRLQQAEARAVTANKQVRDLAATLNEMDQANQDERVEALQTEIESLRESLIEAEEAMALAAASEGELSTEWVMHTITRYSGQLEEAEARIQALEAELAEFDQGAISEVLVALAQELRTPMTSIAGYTDILLSERMGILGVRQREFVQRVQANATRMEVLLEQIIQFVTAASEAGAVRLTDVATEMDKVVDTAVNTVLHQIREKNLRPIIDMDTAARIGNSQMNKIEMFRPAMLGLVQRDRNAVGVNSKSHNAIIF
ncbi:MAG: histidine kinase dimerization/phospho-acceptor domain-containing protein [Anaerolineae bacterium]